MKRRVTKCDTAKASGLQDSGYEDYHGALQRDYGG